MASSKWGGDESKLPKWARDELHKLRTRIVGLEQQLAIAMSEAPTAGATGKVLADNGSSLSGGFPLHDRAQVLFTLPSGKIACMIRQRGEETVLDINAHYGRLLVHPQASNALNLMVGD